MSGCLGLPKSIQTTNDNPTSTPKTRSRTAVNDLAKCTVQEEKIQNAVTLKYGYDAFGNPAFHVTTAVYDLRGLKTRTVDPDAGTWTYTYNPFGELKTQKDAKGQVTTFNYERDRGISP
ncbi:hypothetical protein BH24PSE2_BH24PSE2_09760 [soil metagenome]